MRWALLKSGAREQQRTNWCENLFQRKNLGIIKGFSSCKNEGPCLSNQILLWLWTTNGFAFFPSLFSKFNMCCLACVCVYICAHSDSVHVPPLSIGREVVAGYLTF